MGKNAKAVQTNEAANEVSRENQIAFNPPAENISEENILPAPAAEIDGGAPSEKITNNKNNFSELSLFFNKLFTIAIGATMLLGLLYFGYRSKKK
ncbi:hypothetical protein KKE99_01740 [Patescibacteria group bacterium]|nr:hypothetical protein [Patescibacteria group bacterium]